MKQHSLAEWLGAAGERCPMGPLGIGSCLSSIGQVSDLSKSGEARLMSALSPRETEVLALAARGLHNSDIAVRLDLTIHAVKFHLASIYRKLEVTNRTEAAVLYLYGEDHERPLLSGGAT